MLVSGRILQSFGLDDLEVGAKSLKSFSRIFVNGPQIPRVSD